MNIVCQGHDVIATTGAGSAVTKCENLIKEAVLIEGGDVICDACLTWDQPKEEPLAPPKKRTGSVRKPTGRPQNRPHRSKQYVTQESLTFAGKAIMAAVEWYNRGGEQQFTQEMLDQVNLCQRFCAEILQSHGRPVGSVGGSDD